MRVKSYRIERLLASLLLVVLLSGYFCPLSVQAMGPASSAGYSTGSSNTAGDDGTITSVLSLITGAGVWRFGLSSYSLPGALFDYFEVYDSTALVSDYIDNQNYIPIRTIDVNSENKSTLMGAASSDIVVVPVGDLSIKMQDAIQFGGSWMGTNGTVPIDYDYNTLRNGFSETSATSASNAAWTILLARIQEMVPGAVIPTSFAHDDILQKFKDDLIGNYTAANGVETLNEYTIEYYFTLGTMGLFDDEHYGADALSASTYLSSSYTILAMFEAMNVGANGKFTIAPNTFTMSVPLSIDDNFPFNAKRLGALGLNWKDPVSSTTTVDNTPYGAKELLNKCIASYWDLFVVKGLQYYSPTSGHNVDYSAPDFLSRLYLAHDIDTAYGDFYPWVHEIYTWKNNVYTQSLSELYDALGDPSVKGVSKLKDITNIVTANPAENIGDGSPIDRFYSFNNPDKVITKINFDAIVNDATNTQNLWAVLESVLKAYKMKDYTNVRTIQDQMTEESGSYLSKLMTDMGIKDDTLPQVIADGTTSIASTDVYFSDYILQGMTYSSTYIPMRTNVYDKQLIKSYDESFKKEFFDKYGYLRKALLIDTNGSSVVSYYNSSGTAHGNLKLCTLRDLLYNDDGSDILLYLDTGMYNADFAKSKVEGILKQKNELYTTIRSKLAILSSVLTLINSGSVSTETYDMVVNWSTEFGVSDLDLQYVSETTIWDKSQTYLQENYNFSLPVDAGTGSDRLDSLADLIAHIDVALMSYAYTPIDDSVLKTGSYTQYDYDVMSMISTLPNGYYVDLEDTKDITLDNYDSILPSSSTIKESLNADTHYTDVTERDETRTAVEYEAESGYTSMMALSFVSYLYRSPKTFTMANLVATNMPVFMASDDMCDVAASTDNASNIKWYQNSLLNFMLVQNIKANLQIDYAVCLDLDCPLYMDIFGNILTESGLVVIPAASNATLHTARYKDYNVSFGLYNVYGKEYKVPISMTKAYDILFPYFTPDLDTGYYEISNLTVTAGSSVVNFANLSSYSSQTSNAIQTIYKNSVKNFAGKSRLNYPAMVNVINEVLRGAYMENIDKDKEGLNYHGNGTYGALVAAAKYESLLDSIDSSQLNSLLAIPDFTQMDGVEYWMALLIKLMVIATVTVTISSIYRDCVAKQFGMHTLKTIVTSVILTTSCITVIPNIFNLTYYAANKFLLEDDAFRILLINEEKRQCGIEIKMTSVKTPKIADDSFTIRLESVSIPWYKEMKNVIFSNVEDSLSSVREEAFNNTAVAGNNDVLIQGDGVYMSVYQLFDSIGIDYLWDGDSAGRHGLYPWNPVEKYDQTASYYLPYYAFLNVLISNVNAYNNTAANGLPAYSYTSKYVSGNRLKTCGLCYNYFTSPTFMGQDQMHTDDIMQLRSIYYNASDFIQVQEGAQFEHMTDGNLDEDTLEENSQIRLMVDPTFRQLMAAEQNKDLVDSKSRYANTFSADDIKSFGYCLWYNVKALPDLEDRIVAMDAYAREFVDDNKDLLNKVTDETFIKCMALYMAIKYNQVFGISTANSLELSNLDSTDLLRLSTENAGDVALSISMSYPRFVYNYGGEASVYAASFLSMIIWLGSFIKPIATLLVFLSVVLSVWVFRVILERPSANLWGYFITVLLLCVTNIAHALLLKFGLLLPKTGLPMIGCLLFMCAGQIVYLLILSYVVGVSLKDWSNLGYNEYQKEALHMRAKLAKDSGDVNHLSGVVAHHDNNWDYYNDLVNQHRSRNT